MSKYSTPTGDKAKGLIRKIDRWILKQEDECTLDWAYQDLVDQIEKLLKQTEGLDAERRETDRREREEMRSA